MAANSNAAAKITITAVERARFEVESLKAQVQHIQSERGQQAASVVRELTVRLTQAEALVARAESSVKRFRSVGRVQPRPTVSVPQAQRAKRALSVLSGPYHTQPRNIKRKLENADSKPEKPNCGTNGRTIENAGDESREDDLTEENLGQCMADGARETGLSINRIGHLSVSVQYPEVFVASVWFEPIEQDSESIRIGHVCVCASEEAVPGRWSHSRFAVFQVLTERARAAVRYLSADSLSSVDAFRKFIRWLASHRTLFSDSVEDRRLGFDSSRGLYMPACVRPFSTPMMSRFTRGSIPARAVVPAQASITSSRHTPSQPSTTT